MSWAQIEQDQAGRSFSIDAAYTRIEIKSPSVNLPINPAAGRYTSLQGSFKGHADIIGLGASYKF